MKLLAFLLLATTVAPRHSGPVHVRGTMTKRGVVRQQHNRTSPDHSRFNNYSTRGNTNPYTGKRGTKDPFKTR